MKYLILFPFLFLAACGDSNSYTSTGANSSIITEGSSGTVVSDDDVTAPAAESSEECSTESRAEGIC